MKIYLNILCIVILCLLLPSASNQKTSTNNLILYYYNQFDTAQFNRVTNKFQVNMYEAIAIAMPEYMRFSKWKNVLETTTLQTVYVNYGSTSIDFSIGEFQMKPSFIEQLEKLASANKQLSKKYAMLRYFSANSKRQRQERIRRLTSEKWQIIYLCAFTDIAYKNFDLTNYNHLERVKILAGYYNIGLHASIEDITRWNKINNFPIDTDYQDAYADLAVYTYQLVVSN